MAKQGSNKKIVDGVRVVCTLPNASICINGKAFATVTLDEKKGPVHISECLDAATAERFCGIDGYSVWAGDEDAHARVIEDALDAARHTAPVAARAVSLGDTSRVAELERQLAEQQRANMAQSNELRDANRRVRELEQANTALTEELDRLKATGARAAA